MSSTKLVAVILIVAGLLALAYGGYTYTTQTHAAKIGPIEVSVAEKHTVPIPVWVGVGSLVLGALLLMPRGRS